MGPVKHCVAQYSSTKDRLTRTRIAQLRLFAVIKDPSHAPSIEQNLEVCGRSATLSTVSETIDQTVDAPGTFHSEGHASSPDPTPNDPPWGTGVAVVMWLFSVALIMIVPAVFLIPYAISKNSFYADSAELMKALGTDPVAIAIQIAAIIPAHLLTLAAAWLVVTRGRTFPFFKTLGWKTGGMKWWHYLAILAAIFLLSVVVGSLLPEQDNDLLRILRSSRYVVFLVAFMATVTAPLVEEVIYRGLLYSALQRSVGVKAAVAIVTILFAAVHLPQYWPSISTMILLTTLSLTLTLVRVRTDNLLPCFILHTIFNGVQSLLFILGPYIGLESNAEDTVSSFVHFLK